MKSPLPLFVGKTVRLTALEPRDTATLARWHQDAQFMRLYDAAAARPKTERELNDYIDEQQKSMSAFIFAARPVQGDEMIAFLELDGIVWSQGVGWVSIGIGDAALRGKGYGTEAMHLLLGFAFGELNLRRVQLTVFRYNTAAIRLYEKLGFAREGVFREFLQRDGQVHDMILYGLLRREWSARDDV